MPVYGPGDELLGTVDRMHGDGFDLADSDRHISLTSVDRVVQGRVYVRSRGEAHQAAGRFEQSETTIPVAEERLNVEKRASDLGTVDIHRHVTEEQQSVPVELRRDEVHVEEHDVPDRPLRLGEDAFDEGTIRVPVRGEEAVVEKEAVVTGEVVVSKEPTTERQTVTDTVRKEHVDTAQPQRREMRQDVSTTRPAATEQHMAATTPAATTRQDMTTTTPVGAQSSAAVTDTTAAAATTTPAALQKDQIRPGLDVIGSDKAIIGQVKEVRANDFLVDRSMRRDVYVPFSAVQDVNQTGINLTVASHEIDDQGWEKPALF